MTLMSSYKSNREPVAVVLAYIHEFTPVHGNGVAIITINSCNLAELYAFLWLY